MVETENITPVNASSDCLTGLWKWKRFLILNTAVVGIITIALVLFIPRINRATSIIFSPPEGLNRIGGLSSLINSKGSTSFGAKLPGVSNTSEDMFLWILNSRITFVNVIEHFKYLEYYAMKDKKTDNAIKQLRVIFLSKLLPAIVQSNAKREFLSVAEGEKYSCDRE